MRYYYNDTYKWLGVIVQSRYAAEAKEAVAKKKKESKKDEEGERRE